MDERSNFIDYQRQLAVEHDPVVSSTKEMREKITDQLIPIKEDLGNLNALITKPKVIPRKKRKLSEESDRDEVEDYVYTKIEEEEEPSLGPKAIKF